MDKARCKYCKKLIACKKESTSGLSGHLKIHRITKNQEKRQPTLPEIIKNNSEAVVSMI